jgi:hypothetical protein
MKIGVLEFVLHIPNSQSLKEKRAVIKSVLQKVREKHNVAVLQLPEDSQTWQLSRIATATISTDTGRLHASLSQIVQFLEEQKDVQLLDYRIEVL